GPVSGGRGRARAGDRPGRRPRARVTAPSPPRLSPRPPQTDGGRGGDPRRSRGTPRTAGQSRRRVVLAGVVRREGRAGESPLLGRRHGCARTGGRGDASACRRPCHYETTRRVPESAALERVPPGAIRVVGRVGGNCESGLRRIARSRRLGRRVPA